MTVDRLTLWVALCFSNIADFTFPAKFYLFFFFGSDEGVGCQSTNDNDGFLLKEQNYLFVSSATSGYVPQIIESRDLNR